jgi:hypothetical protein
VTPDDGGPDRIFGIRFAGIKASPEHWGDHMDLCFNVFPPVPTHRFCIGTMVFTPAPAR